MDSIFLLGDGERSNILQHMMKLFGCTYICLWQYLPKPSNCLLFFDGVYRGLANNNQPSSSSPAGGSRTQRLFDQYRLAVFNIIDNNGVPGLAFKNQSPFMEFKLVDIQRLASIGVQLQFYQEAGVKMAVFMGCNNGEIEIGFNNDTQVDLEMKMKNWFSEDFSALPRELLISLDQNRPSSSSSSMLSLSVDSSELYSPLLFNIPTSSYIQEPPSESILNQTSIDHSGPIQISTPSAQSIQSLSRIRNVQLPNQEIEDDALRKAMLAVMTSPSSSSSYLQSQRNIPTNYQEQPNEATAFSRYNTRSSLLPTTSSRTQKSNMFKRAITFYRGVALIQRQEQLQRGGPRSTLHMISERKRREKLNESFQVLRKLLPPGTKKDKASVLASTTEYLTTLKSQVAELAQRNQILETQLLVPREKATEQEGGSSTASSSSRERVVVLIVPVDQSTSEEGRVVDLQVAVLRGQSFSMLDLAICVLEYLKLVNNVSVMSIQANTRALHDESSSMINISIRLRIEGDEWDESAFQEAIRRVVADLS
ncbi:basic helix-loop-helix transcription factor [Lithospermum erythrorhizon]|uniref:Basic helix-loop-helix transcription factor n=1 Tax=Lithospermum erythrorhizon TaxID=34254 RepID=A0AAV3PMX8_LITER